MSDVEKLKAQTAEAAVKALKKSLGENIIMRLDELPSVDCIPTRFFTLNRAIGLGGIPRGLITEVLGNEGCGKTTFALTVAADALNAGHKVLYIDLEGKVRPEYTKALGVPSTLDMSKPTNGDQAMHIVELIARTGEYGLVIVDSAAMLSTAMELSKDIYEPNMATTARLLSQSMKRLMPVCREGNCGLLFINQYRQNTSPYGQKEIPVGGRALQYASSLTLELKSTNSDAIKKGTAVIGKTVRVHVTKNQVGTPNTHCELTLLFGKGFDPVADAFGIARAYGIIQKSGSWFSFGDIRLGQGEEASLEMFKDSDNLYELLQEAIRMVPVGTDDSDD